MFGSNQVRLHQMAVTTGRIDANGQEIIRRLAQDRKDGIRLSVFPQLALTGFLGAAEWSNPELRAACAEWQTKIIAATADGQAVIFGTAREWSGVMLNAAVAGANGKILPPHLSPLDFLPRYNPTPTAGRLEKFCFQSDATLVAAKYNKPVSEFTRPFVFDGLTVAIGFDAAPQNDLSADALYIDLTSQTYTRDQTMFNTGASCPNHFICGGFGIADTGHALFTLVGGTGRVADGNVKTLPLLEPGSYTIGNDSELTDFDPAPNARSCKETIGVIEFALKAQLKRLGINKVVIGASGGIDSALSSAIYSRVLPPENLLLVNMPTHNNSQTTISLARQLATAIGCNYTDIPIEESLQLTLRQIDRHQCVVPATQAPGTLLTLSPLAVENIQARDRSGRVLSAIASAFGGVFTCNANKSECTVGYGTMYGDISGFFCVLADLWKLEVWDLARCYNREIFGREVIPQGSIDIVPSAELSAAQNVNEGKGDPLVYPWHDRVFAAWTERSPILPPQRMLDLYDEGKLGDEIGYNGDPKRLFPDRSNLAADLDRYWKLFNGLARAKRLQAPPLLSLKSSSFGFDLGAAQAVGR